MEETADATPAQARAAHDDDPEPSTPIDDRDRSADDRDRNADDRDQTSDEQDEVSEARDERAEARDDRAEVREDATGRFDTGAALDRAGAKRDRQGGAGDRKHAKDDRQASSTDRALSARERELFLVDGLTGAHRREAGLMELERDVTMAKRTQQSFVLAFIDVDGLKGTNDSFGHAAGDQLLIQVVGTIRSHFRSYDLIVRYGGDEFLCGLLGLRTEETAERFVLVNADLAATRGASVTAGFAELESDDTLDDLIERADAALYKARQ